MIQETFLAGPEDSDQRLDIFLVEKLKRWAEQNRDFRSLSFSRTSIQDLIKRGKASVSGKAQKANYRLTCGEKVSVTLEDPLTPEEKIRPEAIPLDIFYEDDQILVVNKPCGLLVHPAAGITSGTLVNALLNHCKRLSTVNTRLRPGIVHRLDRETSGLMVVAKDNRSHRHLAEQFHNRQVKKRYVALVEGSVQFEEGSIDAPLARHRIYREKKSVQFSGSAKQALTVYKVLQRFPRSTLVALYPETGRTHQLRVHMAYLGHPLMGDEKYGEKKSFPRLALHAQSLRFIHPKNEAELEFSSLIPEEFFIGL